jgi:glycosyltransferase involved in cell wall biosynthesis
MARRILLLITDLEIGGTPTVVRELAMRLNRPPEVVVEVACLAGWGPVVDQLRAAGVAVTAFDAGRASDFPGVLWRLVRLVSRCGFDTVFSFLVHANAVAAAASLFCRRVRFIQSVQTTQPTPRWHWKLQRFVHPAADQVAVPSASAADAAREWAGVPDGKIVVIPNAVDPAEFQVGQAAALHDPARPFPVGFIGRLDPVKRVPDLLEAVRYLAGRVELHVYGDGADRPRVESEIAWLGIEHLVTLHGAVPGPHDALRRIRLLVLPSAAEGFGLVLIEAMAAGVPVVATNVAGIRDVVRDGETGLLVPPESPERLAEAIARVIDDADLRRRFAAAGQSEVARRFSWDVVLRQYQRLLDLPSLAWSLQRP